MNPTTLHFVNVLLGAGAIALQILSFGALLLFVYRKQNFFLDLIHKHYLPLGFLISLVASVFSLAYSEIVGFLPCLHCWIQRIFIYPQVFLFGVASVRRDRSVFWYSLPLLIFGLIDALYLNYIYYFNPSFNPCDASGASCVKQYVSEFGGYVSIPTLALTTFLALITINLVAYFYKKEN